MARPPPSSFTATEAKNGFGRVLDAALRGGSVVITRHEEPRAVLLSMDAFHALGGQSAPSLETLSAEFDALLARLQTPKARRGLKAAFGASPAKLGKAAVAAARRRG